MPNMLQEALDYAHRGWYVFPCREKPGQPYIKEGVEIIPSEKTPYVSKGLHDATTDEEQITAWWNKWPDAMIGVNAGKSGLFVIDIDKKHINGFDTFMTWNINDTAGLHSFTPSGGTHIVFTGSGKTNTNGKTGIDTRGEGGYFIAPPSVILEGEYKGEYKAFDDWTRTPGVIPDGLMAKLFPNTTVEYVRGSATTLTTTGGNKKQLSRRTLNFLANGAPHGERNASLFNAMADFYGCGYTKGETKETLLPVSQRIGLSLSEFEVTLEKAYSKPRTSSIPDYIQEKIAEGGKNIASKITLEEQAIVEDALLACLICDNTLIPTINDILGFEDFSTLKNRIIYKAINRLYASGMKVDVFTVAHEIEKETDKVKIDNINKMINIYFINTEHAQTYARIIQEKASLRKIETLMDNKEHYIKTGNLAEAVGMLEKDISDIAIYGGAKSTSVLTSKQATDFVMEQTRMIQNGQIEQLKTGFLVYDSHVGGFYSNEMIICAARAGDGKSALALSIINDVAIKQNKPVAFFSLEMSTHESICRLICQLTGLPFKDVYQGSLKNTAQWDEYEKAMKTISESPIYFDDGFGMPIQEIRSKIRKLMEKDIKLVVIDQLEQIKGYDGMPPYIQFDKIAYDIKNFTKEFNVPILLNHQLNRSITNRNLKNPEPILSDLNQAGEKPANQVWVISHHKDEKGKILNTKIKILKNRNGPRIEFSVIYVGERMLFSNPTRPEDMYAEQVSSSDEYGNDGTSSEPDFVREDI